jgi:hypothetical protein
MINSETSNYKLTRHKSEAGRLENRRESSKIILMGLIFLLGSLSIYVNMVKINADPDMFFHIKIGQYILEHQAIPKVDTFSWYGREKNLRCHSHQWLFQIGIYALWHNGGFLLVYLTTAAFAGLLGCSVFALTQLRIKNILLSALIGILAVLGSTGSMAPRPQVVTFVLLAILAFLLLKNHWLLGLMILILGVNIHGALYPIYLLLFGFLTLPRSPIPFILALPCIFLQPLGWGILTYPFFSLTGEAAAMIEYMPTIISREPFLAISFLAFIVLVRWESIPLREGLFAAGFTGLSLFAGRHIPYFFILVIPTIVPYFRISPKDLFISSTRVRALVLIILGIGAAIMAFKASTLTINADRGYPSDALKYVRAHGIDKLWNDWADGGYLLFHDVPSFVDGRFDPFSSFWNPGVTLAKEYIETWQLKKDLLPFLLKYEVSNLLVPKRIPLYRVLEHSRYFKLLYEDETYAIFHFDASTK